jgi:hypothetical protein
LPLEPPRSPETGLWEAKERFWANRRPLGNHRSLPLGRIADKSEADTLPSCPLGRISSSFERAQVVLGIERHFAKAHSDRVEDGVGNRGRHFVSKEIGNECLCPGDKGIEILLGEKGPIFKIHEIIYVRGQDAFQLCSFKEPDFVAGQERGNRSLI